MDRGQKLRMTYSYLRASAALQIPERDILLPMRFVKYENDILYGDKVKDSLRLQYTSVSMRALNLTKHMSAYRSYIQMQGRLSTNALDVTILSKAFSQLPSLETLQVDLSDFTIGAVELIQAFAAFKAEDLLTFNCRHTLPVLVKSLAVSGIKIKVFELGADADRLYSTISCNPKDHVIAASHVTPRLSTPRGEDSYPAEEITRALSKVFCNAHSRVKQYQGAKYRHLRDDSCHFI